MFMGHPFICYQIWEDETNEPILMQIGSSLWGKGMKRSALEATRSKVTRGLR